MLEEPVFEYPLAHGRSCVCLEDGHYCAYLDRNAAVELLFGLYWFASQKPIGEEVDIWSRNCDVMPCNGKPIGLCELHLAPIHVHKKQGRTILKHPQSIRSKPRGIYAPEHDRLDYHVSADEVALAYHVLTSLLAEDGDERCIRESTLFDTLKVKLVK